ncbi:MAG: hypothetical protein ABEI54_03145, partial [Candidatus Bipolaricaulia bacterium]
LNEGTISLGVSLGGKIYATEAGRDRLGKPCTLITSIRIDELSITQNPALRLVGGEDESNGAYIQALAKSAARSLRKTPRKPKQKSKMSKRATQRFLQKALDSCDSFYPSHKGSKTKDKKLKPKPKGNKQIANNDTNTKTGLGGEPNKVNKPKGKGKGFKIGDHAKNPTVKELTRELGKCAQLPPEQMGSDEVINQLSNGAQGLAGMPEESPELINFAKLLQYLSQYAGELQKMADNGEKTRMKGTAKAMQDELTKALSSFSERVPDDIKAKPLRPPQGPGVNSQDIQFPSQYFPID